MGHARRKRGPKSAQNDVLSQAELVAFNERFLKGLTLNSKLRANTKINIPGAPGSEAIGEDNAAAAHWKW